jgi:hypothetical protein
LYRQNKVFPVVSLGDPQDQAAVVKQVLVQLAFWVSWSAPGNWAFAPVQSAASRLQYVLQMRLMFEHSTRSAL